MAAAYLAKRLKDLKKENITISSAGISPFSGMRATAEACQVTKEEGMDISDHRARKITDPEIREADLIFAMEDIHKRYVLEQYPHAANKTYVLNIADPIGMSMDFYRKTFASIKEAVENILKEIDEK